jgi:hypothetical protein
MRLLERINEAFNSPPKKITNFNDAELIKENGDLYLNGKFQGKGKIARLPYGAGQIARTNNGKVIFVDPDGNNQYRIESREKFRYVKFPLEIKYMD